MTSPLGPLIDMFVDSPKNSVQCSFLRFLTAWWKSCRAIFAAISRLSSRLPCLLLDLARLRVPVYSFLKEVRSFDHHLLAYFDGFAFGQSSVGNGLLARCCFILLRIAFRSAFCNRYREAVGSSMTSPMPITLAGVATPL
ncbi:hypothetical protein KCU67_g52, partial [Aureobasidium melanogenum]